MTVSIIVYLVILADQLTKWWAYNKLRPSGEIELIKDALYFKYTTNEGMAFGLLKDHRWIFLLMTTLILAVIVMFLYKTRESKKHILLNSSLGLIIGGGVGNMIDRTFFGTELFCGKVVDFIDFRLINFAIFNFADAAVCIGEALLVIYVCFIDTKCAGKNLFSFSSKEKVNDKKENHNVEI